ncbi:hypothetical protein [Rhizobium mayense]|uniref:Uncharacterized protein n=1 Tax=Rhizobium mayense TaxID=1312184 RepID=A0ABT7K7A0_9HYPH|nr:hypothetical protein [Rhizobium mayense]MDL2403024.1 hypothetical protein [Rhizobium mayense]
MKRDRDASRKLMGALLRLSAGRSDGFTAKDLALAASVPHETARDFLKPDRSSFTESVGSTSRDASGKGKPPNYYRVTEEGYQLLLKEVAAFRRQLIGAADPLPRDDVFRPLNQMKETIEDLEKAVADSEEFEDLLIEAKEGLKGCRKDLKALEAQQSEHVVEHALELGRLESRLRSEEGRSRNETKEPDFVDWLVEKFGSWLDKPAAPFEPVLMLLDGIEGRDPLSSAVIRSCRQDAISVAAFDVAQMSDTVRRQLFDALVNLRQATPLAASKLVLTMDGATRLGQELAEEFKALALPPVEQASLDLPGLGLFDPKAVRQSYLLRLADAQNRLRAPQARNFAKTCASALLALDAANDVPEWTITERLIGQGADRDKLMTAAQDLLGNVVFVDSNFDETIQEKLADVHLTYSSADKWVNAG